MAEQRPASSVGELDDMMYDVIVIGAGLSGLTAAYNLLKNKPDIKLIVLEAKERVGGRTFGQILRCAEGEGEGAETTCEWELGGMWVGRCQPHIMELLAELGIETYQQFTTGVKCMRFTADDKVMTYSSDIPSMGLLGTLDIGQTMLRIERLVKQVSAAGDAWMCENAEQLDSITMETLKSKLCWTSRAKEAIDATIRTVFGVECSQISALYFLAYISAAGNLQKVIEATPFSAQEYKIKGGSQGVCLKLADEKIGWKNIKLASPVTKIEQSSDHATVQCVGGYAYKARRVILASPPTQNLNINFVPSLPYQKTELFKRMPVGHIIKTIITYKKAFWKILGFSGEIVTTDPTAEYSAIGCSSGPITLTFDATSEHQNPAIVVFTCGVQATEWGSQSKEQRRNATLKSLSKFFSCKDMLNPLDYGEKDWARETYNGGCPVYTVTPGVMKYYSQGLRQPFDRIEMAGTESATAWCGFLNGAVQAGTRAAINVLAHLQDGK